MRTRRARIGGVAVAALICAIVSFALPSDASRTALDLGGAGADTTAFHNNASAEIDALAEKAVPVAGDMLLGEDSADGFSKVKIDVSSIAGGGPGSDTTAVHVGEAGEIDGIAEKVAPVAADVVLAEDSADAFAKVKIEVGNLPVGGDASGTLGAMTISGRITCTSVEIPGGNGAGSVGQLSATPVTVVAAQGAGTWIDIISATAFHEYKGEAYDSALEGLQIQYAGAAADALSDIIGTGFGDTTSNQFRKFNPPSIAMAPIEDAALQVSTDGGSWFGAAGTGDLHIEICYQPRTYPTPP